MAPVKAHGTHMFLVEGREEEEEAEGEEDEGKERSAGGGKVSMYI
jgi:hypothetical protein